MIKAWFLGMASLIPVGLAIANEDGIEHPEVVLFMEAPPAPAPWNVTCELCANSRARREFVDVGVGSRS